SELAVQSGRLELASHRTHLADVDPANPEILFEEPLQEGEVQLERPLRLAIQARDEIQSREELRHAAVPALPADGVHHADGLEASVRIDVQVVRFGDAGIGRLAS